MTFEPEKITATNFYEQQNENFVAFFLSDLHLRKNVPEDIVRLEKFVDDLLEKKAKAKLYFLGDVFDFWFGQASPIKAQVSSLLKKLSVYNQNLGEVVFFEGNHDIHLAYSLKTKFGFEVVPERKIVEFHNQKIILEHGDLFDPEDTGYLFLRSFLRKSWVKFLIIYLIPSFIVSAVGDFFSRQSSKTTKVRSEEKTKRIQEKSLKYGIAQLQKYHADVFISGHVHERLFFQDPQTHQQIINTGSWFDHKWILGLNVRGHYQFFEL